MLFICTFLIVCFYPFADPKIVGENHSKSIIEMFRGSDFLMYIFLLKSSNSIQES